MTTIEELTRAHAELREMATLTVLARGWRPEQCCWSHRTSDREETLYVGIDAPVVVGLPMPGTPIFRITLVAELAHFLVTVRGEWLGEIPVPA